MNKTPEISRIRERNVLRSPLFPNVAVNWENYKSEAYMNFLKHYLYTKSIRYKVKTNLMVLVSLGLGILNYMYMDYFYSTDLTSDLKNILLFGMLIVSTVITLFRVYYCYIEQVPCINMSEDDRKSYGWPMSFPTSPRSNIFIHVDYNEFAGNIENSKTPIVTPTTTPNKNIILELMNQNQNIQSPKKLLSPHSIYKSPMKENSISSPNEQTEQNQQSILQQLPEPTNYDDYDKSFDEIQRNKVTQRVKETFFGSISTFFKLHEDSAIEPRQTPDKKIQISEAHRFQGDTDTHYSQPMTSTTNDKSNQKTTYEEVIANKQVNFDRYLFNNHFQQRIQTAHFTFTRWFHSNILKQIYTNAEAYLNYLEDEQNPIQDLSTTPYVRVVPGMSSIDTMKAVLKKMSYTLNLLNDVHHKNEYQYICGRIIDMAHNNNKVIDFGKSSNENPDDQQIKFSLFCAYMDDKLPRDVTAPNPDLPFSSKFVHIRPSTSARSGRHHSQQMPNQVIPIIDVIFNKPLHLDIQMDKTSYEICPGHNNLYFTIILYFYYVTKDYGSYLENFNITQLQVNSFLESLLSKDINSQDEDDDEEDDYDFNDFNKNLNFNRFDDD